MKFSGLVKETHNGIAYLRKDVLLGHNWNRCEVGMFLDGLYPEEVAGLQKFVEDGGVLLFDDGINCLTRTDYQLGTSPEGCLVPVIVVRLNALFKKGLIMHELTHHDQYMRGDLLIKGDDGVMRFDYGVGSESSHPLQFLSALEQEARKAQADLVAKYEPVPNKVLGFELTLKVMFGR